MDTQEKTNNTTGPVCILGMHRSGTSCLTGCLQEIGVYLGDVAEESTHNLKGNRESLPIRQLNESLLIANGGDWRNPPAELQWDDELRIRRDEILKNYQNSDSNTWGFKDPRTTFTLPFWKEGIPQFRLIGTYRHPASVARSLQARSENLSIQEGLDVWLRYNRKLLDIHQKTPFPVLSFDLDPEVYQSAFFEGVTQLSLSIPNDVKTLTFFDNNLRHQQKAPNSSELSSEILEIYARLNDLIVSP